jgi:hypothetical protein
MPVPGRGPLKAETGFESRREHHLQSPIYGLSWPDPTPSNSTVSASSVPSWARLGGLRALSALRAHPDRDTRRTTFSCSVCGNADKLVFDDSHRAGLEHDPRERP